MRNYRVFTLILVISVAAITSAVYIPSLLNGFVGWDDDIYIVKNPYIRSLNLTFLKWAFTTFHFSNWHPLTWVMYAIDYALWGLNPSGYHLTNMLLHSINTLLVVLLSMRLLHNDTETHKDCRADIPDKGTLYAAWLTGIFFGLHPLHVESVAWVSERKDVLYAFFYLLGLMYYMRYVRERSGIATQETLFSWISDRNYRGALFFFVCSLLSKPMAVTLPLVLIILDWYPLKRYERGPFGHALLEKVPFLLLGLISSIVTIQAQQLGGSIKFFTGPALLPRVLTAARSLVAYLSKMIYPANLSPFYPYPKNAVTATLFSFEYLVPFLIVSGITATCIIFLKRQRIWATAWSYYIVTLLPVLGIVQVGEQAMADRYTYLPSLGPFLLVGICVKRLVDPKLTEGCSELRRNALSLVLALFLVVTLSSLTVKQIRIWKDAETLWSRVIAVYPEVPFAYNNRGVFYREHGQYDRAIDDFDKAMAMAPDDYLSYANRAFTYVKLGRPEDALRNAEKAVELNPRTWKTYSLRGKVYSMRGQINEALQSYSKALQLNPDQPELYNSRGNVYVRLGRLNEAVNDYTRAIKLSFAPRHEYYLNRSVVYKMMGNEKEALEDFARAANVRHNQLEHEDRAF